MTRAALEASFGRVLMRLSSTLLWSLIAIGVVGCEPQREAELLEVSAVEPTRLSPTRMMRVRGSGFPPGRDAIVRFEGTMRRPGAVPAEARVELAGRAIAAEVIEARFTAEALQELGGHGTLHGHVVAIFEAANGQGRVIGRSPPLEIDIASATVERRHGRLAHRAAALIDELGLSLAEESPDAEGLPVTLVRSGSIAERAGLIAGDRLLAAEGARAHDPSDVLPVPGQDSISLRMARPGEAAPFLVVLPTGVNAAQDLRMETVRAALIALAWALLILVLLAPSAGLADWIASALRPNRSSPLHDAQTSGKVMALWRRHRRDVPTAAIGVMGLAALPALDRAYPLSVKLEALLLGLLALRVGAAWLGTAGRPLRARLRALFGAAASVFAMGFAFGAVAAVGGTTDVAALSQQPAEPWQWALLSTPIAVPAFGLLCLGGAWRTWDDGVPFLPKLIDDAVLLTVAAVAIAILVGGWGSGTARGPMRLARGAHFLTLSCGLWFWLRRARRLPQSAKSSFWLGLCLTSVVTFGTAALVAFEPAPTLVAGMARVFGGAAALVVVSALTRLASGRLQAHPRPLHRFA